MGAFPMRWLVAMVVFPGCLLAHHPSQPGDPEVYLSSSWIQGEPTEAGVYWAYACDGTGDWGCPSTTISLQHVTCQGCSVIDDLAARSFQQSAPIVAVATSDGPITITATLQFNDTGEIRSVSGTTTGDHEVALEVTCRAIDSATLASRDLQATVPASLFRPCDAKGRLATDTLVVFPVIRTASGAARFPFCSGDVAHCTAWDGAHFRPRSTLSITPAPTGWGRTDEIEPAEFAVLPPLGATTLVSLSAALAGGGTSAASIDIPPLP